MPFFIIRLRVCLQCLWRLMHTRYLHINETIEVAPYIPINQYTVRKLAENTYSIIRKRVLYFEYFNNAVYRLPLLSKKRRKESALNDSKSNGHTCSKSSNIALFIWRITLYIDHKSAPPVQIPIYSNSRIANLHVSFDRHMRLNLDICA